MAHIKPVFRPTDYPAEPDEQTGQDLAELFDTLFPGVAEPEIDRSHTGMAIAAHSPKFALNLSKLTGCVVLELPWCEKRDLLELAIQTVNLHFKCDFSFETRLPYAESTGIGMERLAALPMWRTSNLFDDEQRLVIEYANAVVTGDVPDELSSRAVARFGQRGAVEMSAVIGTFSLWAMLINSARPE
ncbi:MAG: hypothetical protein R3E09_08205 [Novosphingobium sp.]|nr:hypothetical protein [Novosphingobium sp.]